MTRDELLEQLRGHGNHLTVLKGTTHDDVARGIGLMLLGLEELLSPGKVINQQSGHSRPLPYRYGG